MTDTTVELEMAPSKYTKAIWDKEFLCTFSVALKDDKLSTKMLVENKGDDSFDFQAALHSYLNVSGLENISIAGSFAGKEFLNRTVGYFQTEEREEITIAEEYDRVYTGVNDPVLKDSGMGKRVSALLLFANYRCIITYALRAMLTCTSLWVHIPVDYIQHSWIQRHRCVESLWK